MRKQVTIGFTSGKVLGFHILDEHVLKILSLIGPNNNEKENTLVDIEDLMIPGSSKADYFYIRPRDVEMITIGDIPEVKENTATPNIIGRG